MKINNKQKVNHLDSERPLSSKDKMQNTKKCVNDFLSTTSIKGVAKAKKSDKKCLCIVWLIATLIGMGIGTYLIVNLLISFFNYESGTKVEFCNDCRPPFPDITICHVNPMQYLQELSNLTRIPYSDFERSLHQEYLAGNWRNASDDYMGFRDMVWDSIYGTETYIQNAIPLPEEIAEWGEFYLSQMGTNFIVHDCVW